MRSNPVFSFAVPVVFALAFTLAPLGSALAAATGSQPLPIRIQSDHADFNQKSGDSTYTGDVVLTRAGMTLTGSKLVVTQINDRGNVKAVLTGSPAHIDKKPDAENNETVTGHADTIIYDNSASLLTLRGNAVLDRAGGDTITSPIITRNIKTGVTHAEGAGASHRVHITIQPAENSS